MKYLFVAISLFIVLALVAGVISENRRIGLDDKFSRLIKGDEGVEISRIEICGQQRKVVCTDNAVLRYFESAMASRYAGHQITHGISFIAKLSLIPPSELEIGLGIPEHHNEAVMIGYPLDAWGDPEYFSITFDPPLPEKLVQLLTYLRIPSSDLAGDILNLSDDE